MVSIEINFESKKKWITDSCKWLRVAYYKVQNSCSSHVGDIVMLVTSSCWWHRHVDDVILVTPTIKIYFSVLIVSTFFSGVWGKASVKDWLRRHDWGYSYQCEVAVEKHRPQTTGITLVKNHHHNIGPI